MKVVGLNNREYTLNLQKYVVRSDAKKGRSQFHLRARQVIRDVYKSYTVYEEVKLPGSTQQYKKSVLFLDFFLPIMDLGVEVHGQQHYEFIPFFHKTKAGFMAHKKRDAVKREWCELNNITLIELNYADDDETWAQQIREL